MSIKENWNRFTKHKILPRCAACLLALSIVTPVITAAVLSSIVVPFQRYKYDGKEFDSRAEMFAYAKSAATVDTQTVRNRDRWSIRFNNKLITFGNVTDIQDFVGKNIITHEAATSLRIEAGGAGEISPQDYAKLNIKSFDITDVKDWEKIDIYRGKDNTFYTSEDEAKDSYLQIHDAYLFDNIFFRNKEELSVYLYKYYDEIGAGSDNIVITAPNGGLSQPIDLATINEQKTKDYIELFVKSNAKEYLEIKTIDNNKPSYTYYDKTQIEAEKANVAYDFNDVAYVNVISNQGKPNFIVDLSAADEYDLFGPYYTKSSISLEKITDHTMWKKVEGVDQGFVDNQMETQLFSSFIDNIVSEEVVDGEKAYPFNFGDTDDPNDKYRNMISNYYGNLEKNYGKIYDSVINLNNQMKKGKRYSSFYKLPILFIHTLEQLIFHESPQDIIEESRDFYIAVAEYYDTKIKSIIPSVFLKNVRRDKPFSLVDILGFNKYNLDLNVDIESYIDTITKEYPGLLEVSKYYSCVTAIAVNMMDILQFDLTFIDLLSGMNFSNSPAEKIAGYKAIWDILTVNDKQVAENLIKAICTENNLTPDQYVVNEVLVKSVLPKQIAEQNIKATLKNDFALYDRGAYNPEVSNTFQFSDDSLFQSLSGDQTKAIMNLIAVNKGLIDYKYIALIKLYIQINKVLPPTEYLNSVYSESLYASLNKLLIRDIYSMSLLIAESQVIFGTSILMLSYCLPPDMAPKLFGWETTPAAKKFIKDILSITSGLGSFINNFKDVFKVFEKILDIAGEFFKCLPLISVVLTVLENIVSTSEFSYVFSSEDAKYIWNGGKQRSWIFGLATETISDINSIKILAPLQVTEQHILSGRYYNGKIYDTEGALKKAQLQDILHNRFNSKAMRTVYSFNQELELSMDKPAEDSFAKIGSLSDGIDGDLVDAVYKKIQDPNERKYLTDNVYSYANGYAFDKTSAIDLNIRTIINNIQPTKVATIPTLNNGYPISVDGSEDDKSIETYRMPHTSWTAGKGFFENNSDVQYIIVDPNIDENAPQLSDKAVLSKIKELFYGSFSVHSKKILKTDKNRYDKFSEYSTNIRWMNIYEARLTNGHRKLFIEKSAALSWLLGQLEFTVYDYFTVKEEYTFRGNKFKDLSTYLEWVMQNAEEI